VNPTAVTLNPAVDLTGGPLTLGSDASEITKNGAGTATFTTAKSADGWDSTLKLTVNEGHLAITGQVGDPVPATSDVITLTDSNVNAGARLSITNDAPGAASNIAGAVTVNTGGTLAMGGRDGASSLGTASINLVGGKVEIDPAGGWETAEIGTNIAGCGYNVTPDGAFEVTGGGHDIWDNADDFFFVYQEFADGEAIDVSAHAMGFVGGNNGWRKQELMIRDDLTRGSVFGAAMQSFNDNVGAQWRLVADAGCAGDYHGGDAEPTWIRIVRPADSDTFSIYFKENEGDAWAPQGTNTAAMTGIDYIGMAVTSHNAGQLTTATFENVAGFHTVVDLGNDMAISGASEIEISGLVVALLGDATVADGTALSVTGSGGVAFASTTFGDGANPAAATMNTVADLYLGQVSDQGQDLALTKTGAAALVFDETTLASTMDNTTIDVQDGTLGVVGGSNPIGGATIKITDDDVVVVLSGKTGDYSLDNAFDIDASGTLEAHTGWSGVGEDVTVTLNNATATGFDIAAGETLTVNTADGYVLNLDNTVSGGGTFLLADGNVTVANAGVFSAGTPVEVGPDGFLQFTVPATVQPPLTVRGGGALGGDLTGFNYGAGTLTLEDGAIIVQGPGGTHPTWATYGACNLYMSVIDVAGTYDGIGCNDGGGDISSDGPAWEGTYKGVVFDDRFTAAGNFTGTINESEQGPEATPPYTYNSHGFEIALHRDQMFGDNADHVTPLNAPTLNTAGGADHAVTITNDAGMARKWTIGAPLAGTADVYNRVGNDTSEIGYETIELEWVADLVPSGKTVNVQYGTLFMDKNNAMRDAVNDGAAMTFQDAGLVLNDNLQTGQWTIKDGGYVWSNNASRMTSFTGTGSVTFENGSYWHYNYDQPKWELDGLPTDGTGVNIIADEDFFGTDDDNKLMLGQNAMLTTPHAHGGISLNDRSGSTGITTGDPWTPDPSGGIVLQKKDGTITDVQIGRSGSGDLQPGQPGRRGRTRRRTAPAPQLPGRQRQHHRPRLERLRHRSHDRHDPDSKRPGLEQQQPVGWSPHRQLGQGHPHCRQHRRQVVRVGHRRRLAAARPHRRRHQRRRHRPRRRPRLRLRLVARCRQTRLQPLGGRDARQHVVHRERRPGRYVRLEHQERRGAGRRRQRRHQVRVRGRPGRPGELHLAHRPPRAGRLEQPEQPQRRLT